MKSSMMMNQCQCDMDHKAIMDENMLQSLLFIEDSYVVAGSYFQRFQSQIKPSMRTTLATWMLEVCEEQGCTDEVYSLAMNIFDRLMSVVEKCEKQHLQLFGTVCLFIASKLRTNVTHKLTAFKLIEYTDYSITLEELLEWELLVLHKLRWDVASVVPNDFLELFLHRLGNFSDRNERMQTLRKHCYILTALCSTDFKFSVYPASMIAGACILAAIDGFKQDGGHDESYETLAELPTCEQVFAMLAHHANIDQECLCSLKELVDELFKQSTQACADCDAMSTCEVETQLIAKELEQVARDCADAKHTTHAAFVSTQDIVCHDEQLSSDENFDFDFDFYDYDNYKIDDDEDDDLSGRNFNFAALNCNSNDTAESTTTDSYDIIEPSLFGTASSLSSANECPLDLNDINKFASLRARAGQDSKISRSSSSSSGVSSNSGLHVNTNILNINNFRLTPPLPASLPLPTFSKKKSSSASKKSSKASKSKHHNLYTPISSQSNSPTESALHLNNLVVG